VEEHPNSNC